jgi:hypothetical protein
VNQILACASRSEFQETVLNAILMFSKSCGTRDYNDKLVFALVALESALLRDSTESITQNVADRLATVVGRTLEERKEVRRCIKEAYRSRSKYLHHAKTMDDLDALRTFLMHAWMLLSHLLENHGQFGTKGQLIDFIEDIRMPGPALSR